MIACTNTQSFVEKGENCASAISMAHWGLLFHILGYSLTFFGSKLEFQGLSVMLVTDLIIFDVKNQAPQVSFKFTIGDSMSVSSYDFVDIKFCESLDISEALSDYGGLKHFLSIVLGLLLLPT